MIRRIQKLTLAALLALTCASLAGCECTDCCQCTWQCSSSNSTTSGSGTATGGGECLDCEAECNQLASRNGCSGAATAEPCSE